MKDFEVIIYLNPTIHIKDHVIECESQMIQISSVARTWIGKSSGHYRLEEWFPAVALLLCAASVFSMDLVPALLAGVSFLMSVIYLLWQAYGRRRREKWTGLNIELSCGTRYCFVSGNMDLLDRTYQLLNNMSGSKYNKTDLTVDFGEKEHLLNHTDKSAEKKETVTKAEYDRESQMIVQLKALLVDCEENESENGDKILLVNQALRCAEDNDTVGLKGMLRDFIAHDLIVNCNRQGLNLLLELIKESVF